jgi:hypothetical protein
MIGLMGGGLEFPPEWIEGSVFTSFFWPGVILGVVVGGIQAVALVAQYGRFRLAWGLHAVAGLTMMIWIFVELVIMLAWSLLHSIYFASGLIQTVLAVLALGAWPRPFLQRTPKSTRRAIGWVSFLLTWVGAAKPSRMLRRRDATRSAWPGLRRRTISAWRARTARRANGSLQPTRRSS